LGIDTDTLYHSTVELSGRDSPFLAPSDQAKPGLERRSYTMPDDLEASPFASSPHTSRIVRRITDFIRSQALLESDFARTDESDHVVPHAGLANWSPTVVNVERFWRPVGVPARLDDQFAGDMADDRYMTAMVSLHGDRMLEIRTANLVRAHNPVLEAGKLLLIRGMGLLDRDDMVPEYRVDMSRTSNNLALTLHNRIVEPLENN
jgi:hypothetical protein